MAQRVKRLPAMQETQVRFLDREDPLEKEIATHSSTLAWKMPWMEKPGRLQPTGSQRVRHDWGLHILCFFLSLSIRPLPSPTYDHKSDMIPCIQYAWTEIWVRNSTITMCLQTHNNNKQPVNTEFRSWYFPVQREADMKKWKERSCLIMILYLSLLSVLSRSS